jgi:predicted transcriptional regulator
MAMEISLTPEMQERLNQIASQSGKGTEELVQEVVADYLEHDAWFRHKVAKGLASLDRGESVSHDEVGRRMERRLRS